MKEPDNEKMDVIEKWLKTHTTSELEPSKLHGKYFDMTEAIKHAADIVEIRIRKAER